LTDFCHYLYLPLDLFLFEFFWSRNFWEKLLQYLMCSEVLYVSWNQTKSGFTILHKLMLLIRIVWSCVWRKFSSVGKGEWWDEMKYGQKLKLGDAHVTPRNIQEVQASNLRDAPWHPFFINKNIRSSFKTLYFYCFICYVFFLKHL
jgi:hypothetical protein